MTVWNKKYVHNVMTEKNCFNLVTQKLVQKL